MAAKFTKFKRSNIPWTKRAKAVFIKFLAAFVYATIMIVIVAALTQVQEHVVGARPTSERDQAILQNFIEWYAVIYTLALSLIISNAWIRYNRINSEIDREADELALLIQIGKMSGHKILSDLLARAVRIYANYVRSVGSRDERIGIDSNQKIQVINECVAQMVANEDINDSVKTALLNHYAQAYDARNDRFDLLEQRLPLRVWLLLSVFSLAWIWGFFWIDFSTDSLSAYICSCTVFSVTVLFGYALDMDNPIKGFWRMDFTPFVQNKF